MVWVEHQQLVQAVQGVLHTTLRGIQPAALVHDTQRLVCLRLCWRVCFGPLYSLCIGRAHTPGQACLEQPQGRIIGAMLARRHSCIALCAVVGRDGLLPHCTAVGKGGGNAARRTQSLNRKLCRSVGCIHGVLGRVVEVGGHIRDSFHRPCVVLHESRSPLRRPPPRRGTVAADRRGAAGPLVHRLAPPAIVGLRRHQRIMGGRFPAGGGDLTVDPRAGNDVAGWRRSSCHEARPDDPQKAAVGMLHEAFMDEREGCPEALCVVIVSSDPPAFGRVFVCLGAVVRVPHENNRPQQSCETPHLWEAPAASAWEVDDSVHHLASLADGIRPPPAPCR
mmetsp:Transcript_11125/g.32230  ORF Transcript_11125/g.32230 Transcript_11125/m.32230 type:complete len:335 (-) Transcript_11125:1198-2202(-)